MNNFSSTIFQIFSFVRETSPKLLGSFGAYRHERVQQVQGLFQNAVVESSIGEKPKTSFPIPVESTGSIQLGIHECKLDKI